MIPLTNILFLDIETVSQQPAFDELPEPWQALWIKKAEALTRHHREPPPPEELYGRAGIYAEFGRVVCISCGVIQVAGEQRSLLVKSFYDHDEKALLGAFCEMLNKWTPGSPKYLCAHNGREFDFPYLCRRMIIQDICIPSLLNIAGKKPWEVNLLDTMDLWKFGEFKSYTSLDLLAHVLGVPGSKDDMDGSLVGEVYWKEQDLPRIARYCEKDVVTMAQIYLRLQHEPLIPEDRIGIKA